MTAVLLTAALLGELEARWSEQRLPLLDRLQPGLEADEMETLMEPLGLSLPGEARVWWGWHDGVPAASCSFARDREFGAPGFQFLPLAEAVAEYRANLQLADRAARHMIASGLPGESATWWKPTWFPITTAANGSGVACECSTPEADLAPIHRIRWDEQEAGAVEAAASFGEMVTWWIDAFDSGGWKFDHRAGGWDAQLERLPLSRELTGLV